MRDGVFDHRRPVPRQVRPAVRARHPPAAPRSCDLVSAHAERTRAWSAPPLSAPATLRAHAHSPDCIASVLAVSSSRLWLYALWLPAATLVLMHGGSALSRRRALNEAVLGLLSSLGAALLIVSGVKVCVGRLRPDFLARCVPVAKACTGDPHDVMEGRKSFPSGHTALAFAGLGYLSLCLYARFLHAHHPALAGNLWKGVLAALPTAVAIAIGLSRIADYWHHWQVIRAVIRCKHVIASADTLHRPCRTRRRRPSQDVLVGGLIGGACAAAMYRLRYPALSQTDAPLVLCAKSRRDDSCKASDDSTTPAFSPGV